MVRMCHVAAQPERGGFRAGSGILMMFAVVLLWTLHGAALPHSLMAAANNNKALIEEALRLGEEFGVVVGELDEETRNYLGMERAEGVVVYEVIGGTPADLAGIKVKAVIKEIDKYEIRTLQDFGKALKAALATENFTVATYTPPDPVHPEFSGGVNFHFVRSEKD